MNKLDEKELEDNIELAKEIESMQYIANFGFASAGIALFVLVILVAFNLQALGMFITCILFILFWIACFKGVNAVWSFPIIVISFIVFIAIVPTIGEMWWSLWFVLIVITCAVSSILSYKARKMSGI